MQNLDPPTQQKPKPPANPPKKSLSLFVKPVVDCFRIGDYKITEGYSAFVIPINHPSPNVSNTKMVRTSRVVTVLDNGFETENTVYTFVE